MTAWVAIASALAGAVCALMGVIAFMRVTQQGGAQQGGSSVDEGAQQAHPKPKVQIQPVETSGASIESFSIGTDANAVDAQKSLDELVEEHL